METWKIAVAINLASNHAQVFNAITAGLLGINTQVNQLQGGFSRVHLAIGGAFALVTGGAILHGMVDLVEKTKDLSHELTQIRNLGISDVTVTAVEKRAIEIAHVVPGATRLDALNVFGAIRSMMGAPGKAGDDEAIKLMEPLTRWAQTMGNTSGKFSVSPEELNKQIRAADLTGWLTDPVTKAVDVDRFEKYLDETSKITRATHGQVSAQTWLQMAQQGGPALMNLSTEGLATMGIMAQAMGGGRAGTSMMSLFQQISGGTMYKRTAEEMERLGLLKSGEWSSEGGHVSVTPEAAKRLSKAMGDDPLNWINQTVLPAMRAHGITDKDAQIDEVFRMLQRQTTQRFTADEIRNMLQMERERKTILNGASIDESAKNALNGDVEQNLANVEKAWQDLLYAVAGPNSENEIKVLHLITNEIMAFTKAIDNTNPKTIAAIGEAIGILGLSLVGAGIVALMAAIGTGGWLILGLGALGAAVVALKAEWGDIDTWLNGLGDRWEKEFNGAMDAAKVGIEHVAESLRTAISALPGEVSDAIKKAFDEIADNIRSMVAGIGSAVNPSADGVLKKLQDQQKKEGITPPAPSTQLHSTIDKLHSSQEPVTPAPKEGGSWLGNLFHRSGFNGDTAGLLHMADYRPGDDSINAIPSDRLMLDSMSGTAGLAKFLGLDSLATGIDDEEFKKGPQSKALMPYGDAILEWLDKLFGAKGGFYQSSGMLHQSSYMPGMQGGEYRGGDLGDPLSVMIAQLQVQTETYRDIHAIGTALAGVLSGGMSGAGGVTNASTGGAGGDFGGSVGGLVAGSVGAGGIAIPDATSGTVRGGTSGANFMHGQFGGIGQNLETIKAAGKSFRANAAAASHLAGFVDDLAAAGAPINDIGGYNPRRIAGSNRWSQHAYGNAIDINQVARNRTTGGLAQWAAGHQDAFRAALAKNGIISGGDWRHPDFGHFEWGGGAGGALAKVAPAISGAQAGLGSWFSNYNGNSVWRDHGDNGRNASGISPNVPGIALPSASTLGRMFDVTAPNGKTYNLPQVDIGPSRWTGRGIDINAAAADKMGYTPHSFPTDGKFQWKESGIAQKPADQGTHVETQISLDGKVLARHMSKHLSDHFKHPKQAPFADGRRGFWSPDMQVVTT